MKGVNHESMNLIIAFLYSINNIQLIYIYKIPICIYVYMHNIYMYMP